MGGPAGGRGAGLPVAGRVTPADVEGLMGIIPVFHAYTDPEDRGLREPHSGGESSDGWRRRALQAEADLIAGRALLAHCSVVLAERTVERDAARAALEEAEAGIDARHAEITAMQQECDRRAAETGLYCREKALRDRADEAEGKAAQYQIDWVAAKHEFGDAVAKLRANLVAMTAKRDAIFEEATATGRDLFLATAVLQDAKQHDSDITFAALHVWIQVNRAAWLAWSERKPT